MPEKHFIPQTSSLVRCNTVSIIASYVPTALAETANVDVFVTAVTGALVTIGDLIKMAPDNL